MMRTFITATLFALAASAHGQNLSIEGGQIFTGLEDTLEPNPGIVIRGGRILSIGNPADAGADSTLVSLSDEDVVLPGIFDLHAHYNINPFGDNREDETEVYPVIFLANGVTTTFPAGEFDPDRMEALCKSIDRGERIGPRIFNSGAYFGAASKGWDRDATEEDVYGLVDYWAERGVRGFKAKRIKPHQLHALIERAHQHGLTVTGHLDSGFRNSVNPRDAIAMGIDRIEHFMGGDALPAERSAYASLENLDLSDPRVKEIVDLFVETGTYFDATLTAYGYFGAESDVYEHWVDEGAFFTPEVQAHVANREPRDPVEQFAKIFKVKQKTVKMLFDADGRITLGTDHVSNGTHLGGFAAHREMDLMVRCGIPPADVLRIATINGAQALGVGGKFGTIEPGKFADLFIIRGNPLEDIRATRNVHSVIKSGVVYKTETLLDSVRGKMQPYKRPEPETTE